jgi:hypothetical protein
MSKVPYTVNVDEYVCSVLEEIRTMCKTLDFSRLPAAVENIQHHTNKMEAALTYYEDIKYGIKNKCWDTSVSDEEFRNYVKGKTEKWKKERYDDY